MKIGGELIDDAPTLASLCDNVAALSRTMDTVIVHGGGPQVTALQAKLSQTATKIAGQRVTSPDDIYAVTAALAGVVNVTLCAALSRASVRGFGCHGASGQMVQAVQRPPVAVAGHGVVDYGEVGDVISVDTSALFALLDRGFVPVIATLGIDADAGRVLNVNGDSAARAIAVALQASLVLLVTSVGGVFRTLNDPSSRFARLTPAEARALIDEGTIAGGMIPKVDEALALLDATNDATVCIIDAQHDAFAQAANGDDRGTRFMNELAS